MLLYILGGNPIGDMGISKILNGIFKAGGAKKLLRLELKKCNIVFATESMTILAKFLNLRALDLSDNCITLDIKLSRSTATNVFSELTLLESFSLSNNKIKDDGLNAIYSTLIKMQNLKVLALANTFITGKSASIIGRFIKASPIMNSNSIELADSPWHEYYRPDGFPSLHHLMLQGHLIPHEIVADLKYTNQHREIKVEYTGILTSIEYPLRYG